MIPLASVLLSSTMSPQQMLVLGILVLTLLVVAAFLSFCEMAYSTVNSIRIKKLADENVKGARRALNIIENYDKTLSTILVGNNLVNIANTTICAYLFSILIANPTIANLANTAIMTIIILIFTEIMPKSFAKVNAEKYALKFSVLMSVTIKVLYPITFFFYGAQRMLMKSTKNETPTVTEDDLEGIFDTMEEEGVLNSADADLFMGVLEINEKTVYDIMTPRVDVVAIEVNETEEIISRTFIEHGYSRIPVYENDKDHMIGILNYKDYFKHYLSGEKFKISQLVTSTLFVAENMKVKDLIRNMQQDKRHLAIVRDEHGGTSGIVTMEDALEEMVGEIYDEHDDNAEENPLIKKISENTYEINAETELEDLFEELEIEHLPDTEYNSVGGYLYELAANLPEQNQVLTQYVLDDQLGPDGEYHIKNVKLTFTLANVVNSRIRQVLLHVETVNGPNGNGVGDNKE